MIKTAIYFPNSLKVIMTGLLFSFLCSNLTAQLRLDVEGDTKIRGRIDLKHTSGDFNLLIGEDAGNNTLTGTSNVMLGRSAGGNLTSGVNNLAVGNFAGEGLTSGIWNTFLGSNAGSNTTSGANNVIIGKEAGYDNDAGSHNTFIGVQAGETNVNGINNTYLGPFSDALNTNSINAMALGYNAKTDCSHCAIIGGTGTSAVKVGLDMTNPLWPLHIKTDDNAISGTDVDISELGMVIAREINANNTATGIGFQSSTNRNSIGAAIIHERTGQSSIGSLHFATKSSTVNAADIPIRMTINNVGNVGIGTTMPDPDYKLEVMGLMCAEEYKTCSDERFKKQIKQIENPLVKIMRLEGVTYRMRTQQFQSRNFSEDKKIGLIAQNVEKIFPELVTTQEDGYKAVNYNGMIPILIEGMKAQQAIIEVQKEEMRTLKQQQEVFGNYEKELKKQQAEIETLKSLVEQLMASKIPPSDGNNYQLNLEEKTSLNQNQPNPFSENTLIKYELPDNAKTAFLQVTNATGKVLGKVMIENSGKGEVNIKAHSYPAGTYYYSLVVNGQLLETKRMVLTN